MWPHFEHLLVLILIFGRDERSMFSSPVFSVIVIFTDWLLQ